MQVGNFQLFGLAGLSKATWHYRKETIGLWRQRFKRTSLPPLRGQQFAAGYKIFWMVPTVALNILWFSSYAHCKAGMGNIMITEFLLILVCNKLIYLKSGMSPCSQ